MGTTVYNTVYNSKIPIMVVKSLYTRDEKRNLNSNLISISNLVYYKYLIKYNHLILY